MDPSLGCGIKIIDRLHHRMGNVPGVYDPRYTVVDTGFRWHYPQPRNGLCRQKEVGYERHLTTSVYGAKGSKEFGTVVVHGVK